MTSICCCFILTLLCRSTGQSLRVMEAQLSQVERLGVAVQVGSPPFSKKLNVDIVYMIMEALADDIRVLKCSSLVCYDWFRASRRWMFRVIGLHDLSPPIAFAGGHEPLHPPPDEHLLQHLDLLAQKERVSVEGAVVSSRLTFDFRRYVEEIHVEGVDHLVAMQRIETHQPRKRPEVVTSYLRQIVRLLSSFPNLRVVSIDALLLCLRPSNKSGLLWPLFCALADRTTELRLRFLREATPDSGVLVDMKAALDFPAPRHPCKIRALDALHVDSQVLAQLFRRLRKMGQPSTWPHFTSLRLPLDIWTIKGFPRVFSELSPRLEHLRIDVTVCGKSSYRPVHALTDPSCRDLCSLYRLFPASRFLALRPITIIRALLWAATHAGGVQSVVICAKLGPAVASPR